MCIGCLSINNCKALDFNNDNVVIVAGDGSFENPYILEDNDNEIIRFIENNYESKKCQLNMEETSTYGLQIFTGSTQVDTSKTIKYPASYWYRTSGGGSIAYNGSLVFQLIDYTHYSLVGDMLSDAVLGTVKSTLNSIIVDSYDSDKAIKALTSLGISNSIVIGSLLPGIGYAAAVYGGITSLKSLSEAVELEILATAYKERHHVMTVHYKTSYNGAWYLHSTIEEAQTQDNPQIPKNAYGTGKFENEPRIR